MRICKNKITDTIAEHFSANALKIPETRIQPMHLLEIENSKPHYLGEFKWLIKGEFNYPIQINNSIVAQVSNAKTKSVDFEFGFKILENFLKAFKMDPAAVSSALKGSKKIAFSFSEVERRYIDLLQLGNILSGNDIIGDPENINVKKIMGNDQVKLGLITDALTSNNFSLSTYGENDTKVKIDIPILEGYIADAGLDLTIVSSSSNEVKFQGTEALTFAFSCAEIKIDMQSGKFSIGDWLNNIKSAKGVTDIDESKLTVDEWNKYSKMMIDDELANPLLIEF